MRTDRREKQLRGRLREEERRRESVRERINRILDVPEERLMCGSYIEMRGQYNLRLSGCRKILMYAPERIVLSCRRGTVSVDGKRLVCISYHTGNVEIEGLIEGLYFRNGGREERAEMENGETES